MKKKIISFLTVGTIVLGILVPYTAHAYPQGYWTYKYLDGKLTRIFVTTNDDNREIDKEILPDKKPETNEDPDTNINDPDSNINNPVHNDEDKTEEQEKADVETQLTADESRLIELINKERVKAGKRPLTVDMEVMNAARLKSKDMVENKYFSHTSPTYGSPWEMLKFLNIPYKAAGENIAINGSVSKVHWSFMASSGHKANILSSTYTHVGVGISKRTNGTGIVVTEMFIKK